MIEKNTKEYNEFKSYYDSKASTLESLLRSKTFLPFALELLRYETVFTKHVPLGAPAATDFVNIFINPDDELFTNTNVPKENMLTFAYLHEISHIIFSHDKRGADKDIHLWRYATDYMINLLLRNLEYENKYWDDQHDLIVMNIESYKDKILFNESFKNMTEEEIYEHLQENGNFKKEESEQSYKDFLDDVGVPSDNVDPDSKIKVTKTELELDGKVEKKTFIDFPESERPEDQESKLEEDVSLEKTMFETNIMNKGFENAEFEKFLKKLFKVKVDWEAILRDSLLIELQKSSDISYGKPRMTWLVNPTLPYLPNYTEEEKLGTVIVLIDESASITDEDISAAVRVVQQSDSYYKNVYVIKHDTKVKWDKLYDKITEEDEEELLVRRHRGGTSHIDAFNKVIEFSKLPDNMISLVLSITDLFSDIQEAQKILPLSIPRIYLRSNKAYENINDIQGRIITIE